MEFLSPIDEVINVFIELGLLKMFLKYFNFKIPTFK